MSHQQVSTIVIEVPISGKAHIYRFGIDGNKQELNADELSMLESEIAVTKAAKIQEKALLNVDAGKLYYYQVKRPIYLMSERNCDSLIFIQTDRFGKKIDDHFFRPNELRLEQLRVVARQP
jgi:hypothetical protein